jgi:hypothetical protein
MRIDDDESSRSDTSTRNSSTSKEDARKNSGNDYAISSHYTVTKKNKGFIQS